MNMKNEQVSISFESEENEMEKLCEVLSVDLEECFYFDEIKKGRYMIAKQGIFYQGAPDEDWQNINEQHLLHMVAGALFRVRKQNDTTCPFCGGEVKVAVCDDEGNIKRPIGGKYAEEYEKDPWSGLRYKLWHDETMTNGNECPIAHEDSPLGGLGRCIYKSREDAFEAWNARR